MCYCRECSKLPLESRETGIPLRGAHSPFWQGFSCAMYPKVTGAVLSGRAGGWEEESHDHKIVMHSFKLFFFPETAWILLEI